MEEDIERRRTYDKILGVLEERTNNTLEYVKEIDNKLDRNYVTQDEFRPVRLIVYGLVGITLTSMFGTLIAVVLK